MLPEFRRIYYWSPTIIILAMTLAILTDIFYKSRVPGWLIITGMCLAVTGNILAFPKHEAIMVNQGYFKLYVQPSAVLLKALKNIESLSDINDPLIERNPVFQIFASKNKHLQDGASLYNNRGFFHAYLGLHKLAVEDFYMAIKLKQDDVNAYNRAVSYHELNQNQRAAENDKEALRLKQDYAEAYNNRGIDSAKHGNYELAVSNFSEAILLKPDFAFAYNNRGIIHLIQGNNDPGCNDLQKACYLGHCKMLNDAKGRGLCR